MPVYSGGGQYQNTHRQRNRGRQKASTVLVCVLLLLIVGLSSVVIWSPWTTSEAAKPSSEQTLTQDLELPQSVQIQNLVLADSVRLTAGAFVSGLEGTGITVEFQTEPNASVGQQTVTLMFKNDTAACTRQATVYRFHMEQSVSLYRSTTAQIPDIRDFVPDESVEAEFVGLSPEQIGMDQYGDVLLTIRCAGRDYSVICCVVDLIGPEFQGLSDLYVRLGNTVSYKTGVSAVDSKDGSVSFTVDAAQVNLNTEGTYTVYYSATDSDGNTTTNPRKVIVEDVDRAAVETYAREVLSQIIHDGMTLDQKIQAVYKYSRHKVLYIGTSNKTSIMHAAYEGFATKQGDCYTYYAMNVVMFDMLGIEHLEVTRIGGTSHHWWSLVKFEDGKYYHVDSTPPKVKRDDVFHGKMTESDLVVYTNDPGVINRRPNFYVYDKTLPVYEGIEIAP